MNRALYIIVCHTAYHFCGICSWVLICYVRQNCSHILYRTFMGRPPSTPHPREPKRISIFVAKRRRRRHARQSALPKLDAPTRSYGSCRTRSELSLKYFGGLLAKRSLRAPIGS